MRAADATPKRAWMGWGCWSMGHFCYQEADATQHGVWWEHVSRSVLVLCVGEEVLG